jgi:hypothetical protein
MDRIECDIYNLLLGFFHSPEKVEDWLMTTKQWSGGLTPEELIDMGEAEDVLGEARQLITSRASRTAA